MLLTTLAACSEWQHLPLSLASTGMFMLYMCLPLWFTFTKIVCFNSWEDTYTLYLVILSILIHVSLSLSLSLSLSRQGTCDSEGSPLVVFTVARHDMKNSDHKAAMQLLFYTLDQLAEKYIHKESLRLWCHDDLILPTYSEPENGVVVIMDMRDITITSFDVRYVTNMLAVLRVSGCVLCCIPCCVASKLS